MVNTGSGTSRGRKIKASEMVRDIQEGLTNEQLMAKYGLGSGELASILVQLAQAGRIKPERTSVDDQPRVRMFHILHRQTREVLCAGSGASLRAVLEDAVRKGTSLAGAGLAAKDLSGAVIPGCDLRRADLSGTDLSRADLSGADLREANLNKAIVDEANLTGADLFGAHLVGAKLSGANLHRANLIHADLTGAVLERTDLSHAAVDSGDFTSVRRGEANLEGIRTPLKDRTILKQRERERKISSFLESPAGMCVMQLGFLVAVVIGSVIFLRIPLLGGIWQWLLVLGQGYLFVATMLTYQGVAGSGRGQGWLILLLPFQFLLLSFFFFQAL
ncbi:MAG: pentapeptide repeat-containing protein [Thermodesulfobacteriota bacterium]